MPFDIVCANSNCLVDDIVKNNKRISQQSDIESMCKILVEKIMFRTERMLKCIEDRENKNNVYLINSTNFSFQSWINRNL